MGTPEFAVPAFQALIHRDDIRVVAACTQPDREAGRGRRLTPSPVKRLAQIHSLPLLQPLSLKDPLARKSIQRLAPDIIVVAAYGKIIPQQILSIPRYGCLNLHPSLLPVYRGASPIPAAILNGDSVSGVTVMLLDAGMDSGPILRSRELEVRDDDTAGSLGARLAEMAADLLLEILSPWLKCEIHPYPQDESRATYTEPIGKGDGQIRWEQEALIIWRKIRAYQPWPGSFTSWNGKNLKVLSGLVLPYIAGLDPGSVVGLQPSCGTRVGVVCGRGVLGLLRLQLEGRREVTAEEFIRGQRDFIGSRLL